MSDYAKLQDLIRCNSILNKLVKVEETFRYFKDGMSLCGSGFALPVALKQFPLHWQTTSRRTIFRAS